MIPMELKIDKEGLLYLDENDLKQKESLFIDKRHVPDDVFYINAFYKIFDTDDYILKYSITCLSKKDSANIKNMLLNLRDKQAKIPDVDFPIGYLQGNRKKVCGTIVRYYPNSISLDNIFNQREIELIGKYYYHDENNQHNVGLLLLDILNLLNEMFENGVYYTDSNPGNIVLHNNQPKIIDFDFRYVKFDNKDKMLKAVLNNYLLLAKMLLTKVNIFADYFLSSCHNFEDAKQYIKRI